MLPELILKEEENRNFPALTVLGVLSGLAGYTAAKLLFPTEADIMGVMFASVPLIYPLIQELMDDERNHSSYVPEVKSYGSLFIGEVVAFTALGFFLSGFGLQRSVIGLTGKAVQGGQFLGILSNNLVVFTAIFASAAVIGSVGAIILTWNASVMGVFFASLLRDTPHHVLYYLPHATFEMGGFLVAGLAGSLVSAATYREDLDRDVWENLFWLFLAGLSAVVTGAGLETAQLVVFTTGLLILVLSAYNVYRSLDWLAE